MLGLAHDKNDRGDNMAVVTVSEALGLLKALNERHSELVALRNENAHRERRFMGMGGDKVLEKVPVYNVKALDKTVNRLALEVRRLDASIKRHNAVTTLENYEWSDEILGLIETE